MALPARSYKKGAIAVAEPQAGDEYAPPLRAFDRRGRCLLVGLTWVELGFRPRLAGETVAQWLRATENLPRIFGLVAAKAPVKAVGRALGVSPIYLYKLFEEYPDEHAAALAVHAEDSAQQVEEITHKVLDKRLHPELARLASSNFQWLAEKRDRKRFGTRHELTGAGGGPIKVEPDEAAIGRVISKLLPPLTAV